MPSAGGRSRIAAAVGMSHRLPMTLPRSTRPAVLPGRSLSRLRCGLGALLLAGAGSALAAPTGVTTSAAAASGPIVAAAASGNAPALDIDAISRAARLVEVQQRMQQGIDLAERQQLDAAIIVFTQLTRDYPGLPEAYSNLAVLQARRGQIEAARTNFERALRTSPSHATAHDNLMQLQGPATQPAASTPQQLVLLRQITPPAWGNPVWSGIDAAPTEAGPATSTHSALMPDSTGTASGSLGAGELLSLILITIAAATLLALAAHNHASARTTESPKPRTEERRPWLNHGFTPPPAAPEARLIEIYRLIGARHQHEALAKAESLVNEMPNFQLAQLVYGDLLIAQDPPAFGFDARRVVAPSTGVGIAAGQLKQDAQKRLAALQLKPPSGTLPRAFLHLAPSVHHAIAVDATHSRLYLFENRSGLPVQVASYYVALGRLGTGKEHEGDQRTPLGVYFVTGRIDTQELDDFYGAGALPLNYPNEHDRLRGRTGSDIWLHGVPADQRNRPLGSSNGCIVMANDDLRRLWRDLIPQYTPVVITRELDWIDPQSLATLRQELLATLDAWRQARSLGDIQRTLAFYGPEFRSQEANPIESRQQIERELLTSGPRDREVRDVTLLGWTEEGERVVVNFSEYVKGVRTPVLRRQYWSREGGQWKIYLEGIHE